ncbi:hypothetical protein PF008_g26561 [Phytophthora fragariae]|uniref:Uncharacterized protein n=1 Tax=Phytophthora fragariae TaxID=53985 RepID=A0A6G0QGW1_9STRA|nr:hypothetical protein PF008_g26561 [Phytophthora fragariae]
MALDAPASPPSSPKLTDAMKNYVEAKLEDAPSMVAQLAYSFLCREINAERISCQAPKLEKVQNFVKKWRTKNKPDSMEPVLEICRQRMYDGGDAERTSESLLVFCDTEVVDGVVEPSLGAGSKANPFRIGLTCMALLES